MAFRICMNRFWLVGGKAIILIGFPLYICIVGVNPLSWVPITTQTKYCTASMRSAMSCTNITKYTVRVLDRHPSEKCSELIHSICPTSMISYQNRCDSACLATEGTWQGASCMQFWCAGSFSFIHHLNISLGANFVEYRSRQTKIHIAIKHPDGIVLFLCSFKTKSSIVMSTSLCQVEALNLAFYSSLFIQAVTGYKCWKSHLVLFFMITSQWSSNICSFML